MDETILFPSPNWFHVSVLRVSSDGWIIYGGPIRWLCVLEPIPEEYDGVIDSKYRYSTHVLKKAHKEKIVSVDISPEWPEKRNFLTCSADGMVKEWTIKQVDDKSEIEYIHGHEVHAQQKEHVVSVGYSSATVAVSVGNFGNLVKWDLATNIAKSFPHLLKSFKPTCLNCSPHIPMHVAVGTKQGVIFVVDLSGPGKLLYKVRGTDDEVVQVGWCPQYQVVLKKTIEESTKKRWTAMDRMRKIQNEPEPGDEVEPSEHIDHTDPKELIDQKEMVDQNKTVGQKEPGDQPEPPKTVEEDLASAIDKKLPDDSFDASIVQEDDMFDIYKDHEADEFGHKKYTPEDIYVKVMEEKKDDFLEECEKLKAEILKKKTESEQSIESLVNAMDKAKVENEAGSSTEAVNKGGSSKKENSKSKEGSSLNGNGEASDHIHKHLLASIGKNGGVRIWSKSGKLVSSSAAGGKAGGGAGGARGAGGGAGGAGGGAGGAGGGARARAAPAWPTLLWLRASALLVADGKSQLLTCNPMNIDSKNKLQWRVVHNYHKRGLYCIATDAPRVQNEGEVDPGWSIWTVAQDRDIVRYSLCQDKWINTLHTLGGFVYYVSQCPYDAGKIAIAVGDGAVRVWRTQSDQEDKMAAGSVTSYWQGVQGKVVAVAWHPEREGLLAFGTAESRVGVVETGGGGARAARALAPGAAGGVFALGWGARGLYAVAGRRLVRYDRLADNQPATPLPIIVDGQCWSVTAITPLPSGLLVGSHSGAIALVDEDTLQPMAVAFAFTTMVHMMDIHPQHTAASQEESPYKNLIAACSVGKDKNVVILELKDREDGGKELVTFASLPTHKPLVFKVKWNEHCDGQLMTMTAECAKLWHVASATCTAVFSASRSAILSGVFPGLARGAVLAGGADCSLRAWRPRHHPPARYEKEAQRPNKKEPRKEHTDKGNTESNPEVDRLENAALTAEAKVKAPKKFLVPTLYKQLHLTRLNGVLTMIHKYVKEHKEIRGLADVIKEITFEYDSDFLKIFGSINDVNQVLDEELSRHQVCGSTESYLMLLIFRGEYAAAINYAAQKDCIDTYLLSVVPCVSYKYWKDVTQLYVAQIDRLIARGEGDKFHESRWYGGGVYRKVGSLLAMHDVIGAVNTLLEANMFMEAYILCRLRHMDSIADQTLRSWAARALGFGQQAVASICYIALGDISKAATILGKSNDQENLSLAADLAKLAGHNAFADHVEKKAKETKHATEQSETETKDNTEQILKELPKRIELLLKEKENMNIETNKENSSAILNIDEGENDLDVEGKDNILSNIEQGQETSNVVSNVDVDQKENNTFDTVNGKAVNGESVSTVVSLQ